MSLATHRLVLTMIVLLNGYAFVGCALVHAKPIAGTRDLAGVWHGRVSGIAGHAMAVMTVADTGAYEGTIFLDTGDRRFAGAIIVLNPERVRYQGTFGNGSVRLEQRGDGDVLRFVQDGGGGGASFKRQR